MFPEPTFLRSPFFKRQVPIVASALVPQTVDRQAQLLQVAGRRRQQASGVGL